LLLLHVDNWPRTTATNSSILMLLGEPGLARVFTAWCYASAIYAMVRYAQPFWQGSQVWQTDTEDYNST